MKVSLDYSRSGIIEGEQTRMTLATLAMTSINKASSALLSPVHHGHHRHYSGGGGGVTRQRIGRAASSVTMDRCQSPMPPPAATQQRPASAPLADEESGTEIATGTASDADLTMKSSTTSPSSTGTGNRRSIPMDVNMYATRKTIAQGIMDLGLMCANASQLKYVLLNASQHRYFQVTVSLIVVSIILQVIVGIIFIVLGRLNINFVQDRRKADMFNNASVILIFLITVVNVLITAFGPSESFAHLYHQNPGKLTSWTNFYHGSEQPTAS